MQHKPDIDISLASSEDNIHTVSSTVMFRTPNKGDDDIHPIYRSQTSTSKRLRSNSIEETVKPKKYHLLKIIVYILVPFSILIPLAIFHFVDAVSLTKSETKLREIMEQTIPRSVVIHLQSERYYASLHLRLPENFSASSLFEKIVETDSGLYEIQNSENDVLEFQSYILSKLRQDVISGSIDPRQCEHRYSLIIESITAKLIGDIRKVILGRLSEMVVSYYYFFRYKEELEILKIIGAFRLLISDRYEMKLYTDQLLRCLRGKSSLETSFRFSHSLKETYFKWVDVNSDLLSSIEVYINNLLTKTVVYTEDKNEDLIKWLNLTNNLSSEFEVILVKLEQQLLQEIDVIISSSQASTAVFALFLSFVLSCTPLTLYVMIKLSSKALDMSEEMKSQLEELETQRERTDLLLYQMLPQQVADQLKYSCDFNAETFEAVTIYFSEVDNFVKICAESNPIEVVTMLNTLYRTLDSRVDQYDAYKVETINDAYMLASGLPNRNGNRHVYEICSLAVDLRDLGDVLSIPHREGEYFKLKIGINTGPCAAGIVGYILPRYCLFGDTINTASRMESTGQASKIHMSSETFLALGESVNDFIIESRGVVCVKGKGEMYTYWLIGKVNEADVTLNNINT